MGKLIVVVRVTIPFFSRYGYIPNSVNIQKDFSMTFSFCCFRCLRFRCCCLCNLFRIFCLMILGNCCISRVVPDRKGHKAVLVPEEAG